MRNTLKHIVKRILCSFIIFSQCFSTFAQDGGSQTNSRQSRNDNITVRGRTSSESNEKCAVCKEVVADIDKEICTKHGEFGTLLHRDCVIEFNGCPTCQQGTGNPGPLLESVIEKQKKEAPKRIAKKLYEVNLINKQLNSLELTQLEKIQLQNNRDQLIETIQNDYYSIPEVNFYTFRELIKILRSAPLTGLSYLTLGNVTVTAFFSFLLFFDNVRLTPINILLLLMPYIATHVLLSYSILALSPYAITRLQEMHKNNFDRTKAVTQEYLTLEPLTSEKKVKALLRKTLAVEFDHTNTSPDQTEDEAQSGRLTASSKVKLKSKDDCIIDEMNH